MTSPDPAEPITILDDLELRPNSLKPFLAALETDYRPGAEARGLRLLHTWITPPVETDAAPLHVVLVWRLDGLPGFWRMRSQNADPAVARWWKECERFVVSRTRRYAVEADSLETFEAAGRQNA